jgi:hypothetical protein
MRMLPHSIHCFSLWENTRLTMSLGLDGDFAAKCAAGGNAIRCDGGGDGRGNDCLSPECSVRYALGGPWATALFVVSRSYPQSSGYASLTRPTKLSQVASCLDSNNLDIAASSIRVRRTIDFHIQRLQALGLFLLYLLLRTWRSLYCPGRACTSRDED